MEIKFIGTGGAFEVDLGNSAAYVDCGGTRFLVDCGHSVFPKLVQKGLADTIDALLVTHLHDDHAGSLSTLILYHQIILQKGRIRVVYPSESFREELNGYLKYSLQVPESRLEFVPLSEFPQVGAIDTFGQHVETMPTWAYYFKEGGRTIVFSGDNGHPEPLFAELDRLGLQGAEVFHDLFYWQGFHAHTYYKDLVPYTDRYKVYGYHCDHRQNPKDNVIPLVGNLEGMVV